MAPAYDGAKKSVATAINTASLNFNASNVQGLVTELSEQADAEQHQTGFPHFSDGQINHIDSTHSFDESTRTYTIEPTGSTFEVWSKGKKITISSTLSIVIPNTTGSHLLYIDADGALGVESTPANFGQVVFGELVFVSEIYWNATQSKAILIAEERHGLMSPSVHRTLHFDRGSVIRAGFNITSILTDQSGNDDSHAQLSMEGGTLVDEDIANTSSDGSPQDLSPIAQIPVIYRIGTEWRKKDANDFPLIADGEEGFSGSGRLPYNEDSGGSFTLTELSNGNFVLLHIAVINDLRHPVIAILGQQEYSSLGSARDGAVEELSILTLEGLPARELHFAYTLILQTQDGDTNSVKAHWRSPAAGEDFVDFRDISISSFAGGTAVTGLIKSNFAATAAPTVNNDATEGYSVGSLWVDTANEHCYQCVSPSAGAAIWRQIDIPTVTYHEPIIRASSYGKPPGAEPTPTPIGSILGLAFDPSDEGFQEYKIPVSFVGNANFHVHWTKNVDSDEDGNEVKWQISYTVFDGESDDINVSPTVISVEDTYADSGTTTRTVYRTADIAASGFIPGYYIGIKVESVTPTGTPISGNPVLISLDLTFDKFPD